MKKVIKNATFNNFAFVEILKENGFDVHSIGGTAEQDFNNGEVLKFKNGQYQLIGTESAIITTTANTFYETLIDVEKKFDYKLFGQGEYICQHIHTGVKGVMTLPK